MTEKQSQARVLAYYLPQFHPIPENDQWWGKGFTEWTNVGKAKPLFPGHYQPHVPTDLGYYDLRVPETREAQAQMAREAGVEGFVYWHYWFGNGKRLLERPFNEVLVSGQPDFPFALAWANESWSGMFHGLKKGKMLIEQTYPGDDDYIAHFETILPALKDKRYITCCGKPIFVIYKPEQLPDAKHFIDLWQDLAMKAGLKGIYFIAYRAGYQDADMIADCRAQRKAEGFDALNVVNNLNLKPNSLPWWLRIIRNIFHQFRHFRLIPDIRPYDISVFRSPFDGDEDFIQTVVPNWDHTPRTGKDGNLIYNSTPTKFREAMEYAVKAVKDKPYDKRIIFVKSWNEWAEGNYLEPDIKWGHQYLEALQNAVLK